MLRITLHAIIFISFIIATISTPVFASCHKRHVVHKKIHHHKHVPIVRCKNPCETLQPTLHCVTEYSYHSGRNRAKVQYCTYDDYSFKHWTCQPAPVYNGLKCCRS